MKTHLKPLALYAGAVALCLLLLASVLQLWRADLRVPFLLVTALAIATGIVAIVLVLTQR